MGEIKLAPVAANPPDMAKESPMDFLTLILGRMRDESDGSVWHAVVGVVAVASLLADDVVAR